MKKVVASDRVPFNDLSIQWRAIADNTRRDIDDLFTRSTFILGPYVEKLERNISVWLRTRHAIGVNSGSSALHLAMLAANIRPGDEVLVPAHTFIATLWGVLYVGATPVLCDVDEATGTIDLIDAERKITPRTRAIIPVHLYGQPADMAGVMALAGKHGLIVVEDAAQAIGAYWRGNAVGTIGTFGCFSFYPGKNLGAAGEAGLVVAREDANAARVRSLRNHGQSERYIHAEVGFNYRLDGFQAVVLDNKLKHLDAWTNERRRLAARYTNAFMGVPIEVPIMKHGDHVWHLYVVRHRRRDDLRAYLDSCNIETGLHYPVPVHKQPCMLGRHVGGVFPVAERWATQGLSLPLFAGMTDEQQNRVIVAVQEFFRNG